MRLVLRPEAEADLVEAFAWYERRQVGLGSQLLNSVEAALSGILESPEAYPIVHRRVRRALMRRFPYAIFFIVGPEQVTVIAIMHARRTPRRWQGRS